MTNAQERETIINWNDEEAEVSIYTASSVIMRKCLKLGFKLVKTDRLLRTGKECSWWLRCEKGNVHLRKILAKRKISQQTILAARERMLKLRSSQDTSKTSLESQIRGTRPCPPSKKMKPLSLI